MILLMRLILAKLFWFSVILITFGFQTNSYDVLDLSWYIVYLIGLSYVCGFILLLGKLTRSGFLRELTRSGLSDVWDTFILPDVAGFNLLFDEIDIWSIQSFIDWTAVELLLNIKAWRCFLFIFYYVPDLFICVL